MDRETRRMIEEYRRTEAGPLENNLIDELVAGELDRKEFLQRATMFGLSAGTIGALLRYARRARRRVRRDRSTPSRRAARSASASPAFGASLEPYLLNEGGSLAFAGIPGEYLTFTNPDRAASLPVARDELEAERERDGLDVPDPQGRASSTTAGR